MTFDYAELATTATELLTEFGQNVTRRAYTIGAYDPATGSATPTTADTTRKGAVFDYNLQGAGASFVRGTQIQAGDKQLLLDAAGTVTQHDHFIIGGVEYVVQTFSIVNPAGTPVMHDIHLRFGG